MLWNRTEADIIITDLHQFLIKAIEKKIPCDKKIILDLRTEKLNSHDIKKLFHYLPLFPNILVWGLENKELNDKSIKNFANALKKCPKNSWVLAAEWDFRKNKIEYLGAKYLANILSRTEKNFKINLSDNNIKDLGLYYFARSLKNAPENFTLNLSENKIGHFSEDSGVKYLAEALKNAPIGFKLDLSFNRINNDMAKDIAKNLKFAPPGFEINLNSNQISDEEAKAFADNLCHAPHGFKLKLENNHIRSYGRQELITALSKAPQVINLTCSFSNGYLPISTDQALQLENQLRKNQINYAALGSLTFLRGEFAYRLPVEILDEIISYVFPFPEKKQNKHFAKNVLNFFQPNSECELVSCQRKLAPRFLLNK